MKKYIFLHIIFTIIALLSSTSCLNDDLNNEEGKLYNGKRVQLGVSLQALGTSVTDSEIKTVRVIVFSGGALVSNEMRDVEITPGNTYDVIVNVAEGNNNFYIICNETTELTGKLASLTVENSIDKISFETADIKSLIPMYNSVMNALVKSDLNGTVVTVNGTTTPSLAVKVDRLMAKINLTVIKNIPSGDNDFVVEELSVRVCRMPKSSFIKPNQPHVDGKLSPNITLTAVGSLTNNGTFTQSGATYEVPAGVDNIKINDIYIPEHILTASEKADEATYLIIDAKYKFKNGSSSQSKHSMYTINLGNNPPTDNNIERNNQYDIFATITGIGAMGIYAEIVPITEYYHPVEWKAFEGYTIVSENASEYGLNSNIWYDYSQYYGVLKITKNKIVTPALFRYGSLTALKDTTVAGAFNAATDVLWNSHLALPTTWDDIKYTASGDIEHTVASIADGRGDPCRLVGLTMSEIQAGTIDNGLWRMPNESEMAWLNTAANDSKDAKATGFYSFNSILTPATGYRAADTGDMIALTKEGRYWCSNGAKSFIFSTATNTKTSLDTDEPKNAYAIRCIRTTIHPSRFVFVGKTIRWDGETDATFRIFESFLTPFWRVISPGSSDLKYKTTQGGSNDKAILLTVTPLPDPYTSRTFEMKLNGYGIDGKVHEVTYPIIQEPLRHDVTITLTDPLNLPTENGYLRIPQGGLTLKFKMDIAPKMVYAPYKDKTLQWRAIGYKYTDREIKWGGSTVTTSEESEIIIPPNDWGHIVAIDIMFNWVSASYPPYIATPARITFIQEK